MNRGKPTRAELFRASILHYSTEDIAVLLGFLVAVWLRLALNGTGCALQSLKRSDLNEVLKHVGVLPSGGQVGVVRGCEKYFELNRFLTVA